METMMPDLSEFFAFIAMSGVLLAYGSQLWLIFLMMRFNFFLAMLSFVIPFWTWFFAYDNWDIGKRPVICQLIGIATAAIFGIASLMAKPSLSFLP